MASLRRTDDGLDRPPLPVLPSPVVAARAPLHRDGDRAGGAARRSRAAARLRSRRAPGRAAARRRRSARAGAGGARRRGHRLRRDQSQRRLSVGSRAVRPLRRVPDARAGSWSPIASPRCAPPCRFRSRSSAGSASTSRTNTQTSSDSSKPCARPAATFSSCTRARPGSRGCRRRKIARSRRSTTNACIASSANFRS